MSAHRSGFTLIETLIGTALLAIFFAAVAMVLQLAAQEIGAARVRSTAYRLIQEQLELVRNMPYVDVGTIEGIPDGLLEPTTEVDVNGQGFTLATTVVYVDDPYDGTAPTDTLPNDYKRVRVAATWPGMFAAKEPLVMWTDMAPRGQEGDITGGTIEVTVTNAQLQKLQNVMVRIQAPTATPAVDLSILTDADGTVVLPGAPVCNTECYRVSVTKSGYTTDRTYSRNEVANPTKPDLSVLKGGLAKVTLSIDRTSSMTFRAVRGASLGYPPFQGVQFRLTGSKQIGRDIYDQPVYKFNSLFVTGAGGQVIVPTLEWDTYTVSIPIGSSVDFAGSWPIVPLVVVPGQTGLMTMVVAPASALSMLVTLLDNTQAAIASASVLLRNDEVGYVASQSAGMGTVPDRSQAFFAGLPATTSAFLLEVLAPGFDPVSTLATVSGDLIEKLILAPVED